MKRSVIIAIIVGLVVIVAAGLALANRDWLMSQVFRPTGSSIESASVAEEKVETVAESLVTPWSIAFLPDGTRLVSERGGTVRVGDQSPITIDRVDERGEGGLLGLAVHPDFVNNQLIYLYYTTNASGTMTNQVDRVSLRDGRLVERQAILQNIPGATTHNGGAIEFGPDDNLYVATGDAAQPELAQDLDSLAGKILRLNDDGSTPDDNPYGSPVWSYGHRNPQGIAWDNEGRLWSVEHGPRANDELNLITKGGNYGWPEFTGTESGRDTQAPQATSGDDETWAPSRLVYADGSLYFTGLRGQALYRAVVADDGSTELSRLFDSEFGRLRALAVHDGALYFGTSNRDGRGQPSAQDDRILRVDLEVFN